MHTAYLVLAAFFLGLGSVLAKGLLTSNLGLVIPTIGPLALLTCQLAGSIGFLVALNIARRRSLAVGPALSPLIIAGALVGLGAVGTIMALTFMPVGEASVIFATQPIAIIAFAGLVLSERMEARTILLCGVAIAGVILIVAAGGHGAATNRLLGMTSAVFSTLAAAIYVVCMRRITASTDPLAALVVVQITALSVAILVWAMSGVAGVSEGGDLTLSAVTAAAASGLIYYGLAFYVYLLGLRRIEAGRAGVFLSLVPVFTISLAYVLLDETLTLAQWIGAAVVLAAVVGVSFAQRVPRTCLAGIASPVPNWLREDIGLPSARPTLPEDWDLRWK